MKTSAVLETYQFARRGQEWFLKREGAADPMEIYLNMSRDRALVHALDRLKGQGGTLRIHDEDGYLAEVRSCSHVIRAEIQAMAA